MKEKITNINRIKVSKKVFIFVVFLLCIFIGRIIYLCLVDYKVGKSTISAFIKNRNVEEEILMPNRGTIYDKNGNALAEDVASYTIIAYLDETRSENSKKPLHVTDIEHTANTLAEPLDMEVQDLIKILSKDAYQVELGSHGRNLSQIEMEKIRYLKLPGIDFIKSSKRYYPNGDFASYMLGYTVTEADKNGNEWFKGELGIEEYYNEELTGETGFVTYEKDRYGYRIANGREYVEDAKDGNDIYLTIDDNVQLFIENAVKSTSETSKAEWVVMMVADAKTGSILGYSSTPSYNPNEKNLTSYLDPIVSYTYEPGSTMKIFSYMCAIENGKYNGTDKYMSGKRVFETGIKDKTMTISDWNKTGWGELTYDQGFALSSNIAVASLMENNVLTKEELKACYKKYGFGTKTGFTLNRESPGKISFKYNIEGVTAAFGQGITITPIQMIQSLTSLANNGDMLKPYLVSKIVDSETKETTFVGKRKVVSNIASKETITKMKSLMKSVIQPNSAISTGSLYYMDGYDLIGKTGTAQIANETTGEYLTGSSDYIYSFAGLYPGDNPEVIIYTAIKKPKDTTNYVAPAVKDLVINMSKYLNLKVEENTDTSYKLGSYVNKKTDTINNNLEQAGLNVVLLGDGDKIINQYPSRNKIVYKGDKVFLLTNNYNKELINLIGYSYKDAKNILKLMNIESEIKGKGYVVITEYIDNKIILYLEEKFKN